MEREREMNKMLRFKVFLFNKMLKKKKKVYHMANYSSQKQKATPMFTAIAS